VADDFRGDPGDRERSVVAVALAIVLLLAVGGGIFLYAWYRTAARQAELRVIEAERAARDAAEAARISSERPAPSGKPQIFSGRVIRLGGPAGANGGLALAGDDGTTRPILADAGSLKLDLDARLRDRPVRLTAISGPSGLQVVLVQTVTDDGVCDVDYWCDICRISLTEPGPCFCCGEETKLRERPAE
jgi:hypothetical protein